MKEVSSILLSILVLLLAAGTVLAQTGTPPGIEPERRLIIRTDDGVAPVIPSMVEPITAGGLLDDVLVRNKPLAAAFESETIRTTANGTSVVRRVMTKIYRDSDGRTRREQIVHLDGAPAVPGEAAPIVTVYDPVTHYGYSINRAMRTAYRFKLSPSHPTGAPLDKNKIPSSIEILRGDDSSQGGGVKKYKLEKPVLVPLGKQLIAGVQADGGRLTIKVPAGALDNAAPIETIYETWFAADLRMLLKMTVKNPVAGEHNLRLTSINLTEQPRGLFEIPAGYVISEMGAEATGQPPPRGTGIPPF